MRVVTARRGCSTHRKALTLVEMVLVLVILAATAALVIPLIGSVRQQTDTALAAAGSAEIIHSMETFRVAAGRYPERMDSLLENDGTFAAYTRLANDTETPGIWFNVEDLDSFTGTQYGRSLNRASITTVMDHDPAQPDPSASGTILRSLLPTAGDRTVAVLSHVNSNALLAAAGVADLNNDGNYLDEAFVDADASGNPDVKYVAFGLGPQCELVGQMMANAPLHFNSNQTDYGRFIVIFGVYENGDPALLRTVVDSRRINIGTNVTDFRAALRGEG
jgi:type II secretory pathway pseudopilin PulG